jgi:hypothetical protein
VVHGLSSHELRCIIGVHLSPSHRVPVARLKSILIIQTPRTAPRPGIPLRAPCRRRDSTCANRPATSANMSANPTRHRSRRSSAIDGGAAIALPFRQITPEVDHTVAASVITTRRPRSHTAAAVLGGVARRAGPAGCGPCASARGCSGTGRRCAGGVALRLGEEP